MKKTIGFLVGVIVFLLAVKPVFADSQSINFELPTYSIGSISGQDGWGNAVNPAYDQGVVANIFGFTSFGGQSLRISDAVTSGSFGDWIFAKPLTDAVGEVESTNGTFSPGTLQRHFEMQFDIASTSLTQQPGLHVSVSPDRGDGSRMSYLRFVDQADGIHVFFDDVTNPTHAINGESWNETDIAILNRSTAHTIKLSLDTLDGPDNDVVKVWVDGTQKITGTSWEDYYRYDTEATGEMTPRIVKTVIFQSRTGSGPVTNLADQGKGFLFDNLSLSSGPMQVTSPADKNQCKTDGWKLFNNPFFKNQGDCVSYVQSNSHAVGNKTK